MKTFYEFLESKKKRKGIEGLFIHDVLNDINVPIRSNDLGEWVKFLKGHYRVHKDFYVALVELWFEYEIGVEDGYIV